MFIILGNTLGIDTVFIVCKVRQKTQALVVGPVNVDLFLSDNASNMINQVDGDILFLHVICQFSGKNLVVSLRHRVADVVKSLIVMGNDLI